MSVFWLILGTIVLSNLGWWVWADRRFRPLPAAAVWRVLLGVFVWIQVGYLAAFRLAPSWARQSHGVVPAEVLGVIYLWALIVLPATIVITLLLGGLRRAFRRRPAADVAAVNEPAPSPSPFAPARGGSRVADDPGATPALTRRQLLAAAAVAVPPLVTGAGVAYGRRALYDLHVNRLDVRVPNLPPDLEGLTIAHLTDVHVGKFVEGRYLRRVREAANALRADLHLLTGDLIDLSVGDLPVALDFVSGLDPKHGLVMCEGNHDLIDSPRAFYAGVRARGIPLPVDDAVTVPVRGRATPVRVLGLRWGGAGAASPAEHGYVQSVDRMQREMEPGQFSVLLAHHPHAFDVAAAAGVPLTLAGHTHGGLLMLSERVGPAAAMYRYFRGLYRKGDASLYVSTGVGSWFPLRVNARPEIAHLTLRRA